MGKLSFSKVIKFFAISLLGAATAMAAIAVLSSPAAAKGGGGGDSDDYPWDTDNLRYGNYNAKSFNIPFHKYGGYSGVAACQSSVADGFFQSGDGSDDVPEDFPVLGFSGGKWSVAPETSTANNSGCDSFVAQQERLRTQVNSGIGYALDENGNLLTFAGGTPFSTGRTAADLSYVAWGAKAATEYVVSGAGRGATSDSRYLGRVDGHTIGRRAPRAISPLGTSWTVPEHTSISGNFGAQTWHAQRVVVSFVSYTNVAYHGRQSRHLTKAKSEALCRSGFHPRGEDSSDRISGGTGRSLTGLNHANGQIADRFWCRSDLRYLRSFKAEHHTSLGQNVIRHADAVAAGSIFTAYGRLNCYYTSTDITALGNGGYRCVYLFPLPQCTDNGTKREFTKAELDGYTTGAAFTAADDGTTDCADSTPADPPQQAGFTADPCVTADLTIAENRIVGSYAEPGVPASDRTLAVAAGRTAWDLDITSPHPSTASPPRDTTSGSGDPDGCADGSESRADHASSPADAARKQSPAPSYAASDRTDTTAPPNDADGDIDYTAAVKNMAHRYANRVAENTCAAKLAEAEAELSLQELREDGFSQWLSDYKTAADTNASRYSSYRRTPQQSGSGLAILRFNDYEANKATYAALLATRYTNLSSALAAAKAAYDAATDRTAGSSRAAVITAGNSGCAAHYDREITRLKTLFAAAETSALGNGASGIKEERTAVAGTRLSSPPAVAVTTTVNAYTVPDISAMQTRPYRAAYCSSGSWFLGVPGTSCVIVRDCRPGETLFGCSDPGTMVPAQQALYRCPGERYTVSGTVSGTYKTSTRSRTFSATYEAPARGNSTSSSCPSFAVQSGATYASDAEAYVRGTLGTASSLPSVASTTAPATLRVLNKVSLLGSYYSSHADRTNLEAVSADDRNTAGGSLSVSVGSVPSGSPQEIEDFQTAYKTAYDAAFSQAEGHMSGTTWNSFDWRYQTSTLAWGDYQEDPATTYSASTSTPRDGTGCDLIAVASDGSVSVEATRLDYETSSYGKGSVYSTRTNAQRTCKIRRTRTPELLMMYAPAVISGTDTSKTADTRLDTDTAASNAEFYYVDYQPTPAAERFKLYDEAEVFAVKTSLADSPPVFCASNVPATVYFSHAAGAMSDISAAIAAGRLYSGISTDVLRPAGYSASQPPTDHCFSGAFANTANVKIAVFDDTAHSAMNLVYLEKDPADTSGITILASGGALSADPAVAYPGDSAQSSSFYGTTYSMPASLGSTTGWDVLADSRDPDDPDPLDTKIKNRIVARDKPAMPNLPAIPADTTFKHVSAMSFNIGFLDCRPDIENIVFIGNITSATAASNQANDYAPISPPASSSSGFGGVLGLGGCCSRFGDLVGLGFGRWGLGL